MTKLLTKIARDKRDTQIFNFWLGHMGWPYKNIGTKFRVSAAIARKAVLRKKCEV